MMRVVGNASRDGYAFLVVSTWRNYPNKQIPGETNDVSAGFSGSSVIKRTSAKEDKRRARSSRGSATTTSSGPNTRCSLLFAYLAPAFFHQQLPLIRRAPSVSYPLTRETALVFRGRLNLFLPFAEQLAPSPVSVIR